MTRITGKSQSHTELVSTAEFQRWNELVRRAFPSDIYHECVFHRLAEANGKKTARLFHFQYGEFSISLPLILRQIDECLLSKTYIVQRVCDATSVYGYVGPVASHAEVPVEVIREFQTALTTTLRDAGVVSVFSRLHPLIPQQRLLHGLGECVSCGTNVSIDLTTPPDTQWADYRANHRDDIDRLRKLGIRVVHDQNLRFLEDFIEIYYETMRRVNAAEKYFFPRDYFLNLLNDRDSSTHLFVCLREDYPISGGLFTVSSGILQCHLVAALDAYHKQSPVKLLLDEVRLWANRRGFHTMHLGGGVGATDDSLLHFKRGFGRREHKFSVWRWIVDAGLYAELCRAKDCCDAEHGWTPVEMDYFPHYRSHSAPIGAPAHSCDIDL
jgi:hypothetical protein